MSKSKPSPRLLRPTRNDLLRLRSLRNAEYDEVERIASKTYPLDQCPTCLGLPEEVAPGIYVRQPRSWFYRGESLPCNCEVQILLRQRYLHANIGDEFQRLNWEEFRGSEKVRESVFDYLDNWPAFKQNGMGVEFYGVRQGVGKTMAATTIAKELIKRGENVYFIPFLEVISLYERENREELEDRIRSVAVLVLDEVIPPYTGTQHNLFARKFEVLIRHRTSYNLPTIMTTNLVPEELQKYYTRTYSLLAAKQLRVEMDGQDARQNFIQEENLELVMNHEVRPII